MNNQIAVSHLKTRVVVTLLDRDPIDCGSVLSGVCGHHSVGRVFVHRVSVRHEVRTRNLRLFSRRQFDVLRRVLVRVLVGSAHARTDDALRVRRRTDPAKEDGQKDETVEQPDQNHQEKHLQMYMSIQQY